MRAQSNFKYDDAIVGLNNLYRVNYNGDFFINAPFILVTNKTLSTGRTYVLVDNQKGAGVRMIDVNLIDVYFDEGVINLIVQDIISQKTFCLNQYIKCPQNLCKWILIDIDFYFDDMKSNIIKSFCGKCDNIMMKHIAQRRCKNSTDDLLDFEF